MGWLLYRLAFFFLELFLFFGAAASSAQEFITGEEVGPLPCNSEEHEVQASDVFNDTDNVTIYHCVTKGGYVEGATFVGTSYFYVPQSGETRCHEGLVDQGFFSDENQAIVWLCVEYVEATSSGEQLYTDVRIIRGYDCRGELGDGWGETGVPPFVPDGPVVHCAKTEIAPTREIVQPSEPPQEHSEPSINQVSDINDGLVLHHVYEGNAQDISWHDNHGELVGATPSSDRKGNIGGAYHFDGDDDYIVVADSESLDITQAITIAAWVRADDWRNGENMKIIAKKSNSAWSLGVHEDQLSAWINNEEVASDDLPDSRWHHVAFTYDKDTSGDIILYVDGFPRASEPYGKEIVQNNEPLYIGRGEGVASFFEGVIDEVKIWNRTLSGQELYALYQEGAVLQRPEEPETEGECVVSNMRWEWNDGTIIQENDLVLGSFGDQEGDIVFLYSQISDECGEEIKFTIRENDLFFDEELEEITFNEDSTYAEWEVRYIDDGIGGPEYYFVITVNGEEIEGLRSGLIRVSKPLCDMNHLYLCDAPNCGQFGGEFVDGECVTLDTSDFIFTDECFDSDSNEAGWQEVTKFMPGYVTKVTSSSLKKDQCVNDNEKLREQYCNGQGNVAHNEVICDCSKDDNGLGYCEDIRGEEEAEEENLTIMWENSHIPRENLFGLLPSNCPQDEFAVGVEPGLIATTRCAQFTRTDGLAIVWGSEQNSYSRDRGCNENEGMEHFGTGIFGLFAQVHCRIIRDADGNEINWHDPEQKTECAMEGEIGVGYNNEQIVCGKVVIS